MLLDRFTEEERECFDVLGIKRSFGKDKKWCKLSLLFLPEDNVTEEECLASIETLQGRKVLVLDEVEESGKMVKICLMYTCGICHLPVLVNILVPGSEKE